MLVPAAATIASHAEQPVITTSPRLMRVGEHDLCVGVLLPRDHVPGHAAAGADGPLRRAARPAVVAVHDRWLESQWLADQGFAVVVADGRGTGSRGPAWDRACTTSWRRSPLDDQVEALQAVAKEVPELDLVPGRRSAAGPSAATSPRSRCCAAPTCSTPPSPARRSPTGGCTTRSTPSATSATPTTQPEVYDRNSLLADAPPLTRPLLLIHGLADDNVVVARTRCGFLGPARGRRPHDVLPLSGVTHMTPQEVVAENLLRLQVEWLHRRPRPLTRDASWATPGARSRSDEVASSGKWQAPKCPGANSRSSGISSAHRSCALEQRVRNTQPDGGLIGLGRSPVQQDALAAAARLAGRASARPRCSACV